MTSPDWIDVADRRVRNDDDDLSAWWTVFQDPALDALIHNAYRQNLTLRAAGFRILEARAQLGIFSESLCPQTQQATGDFLRSGISRETAELFVILAPGTPLVEAIREMQLAGAGCALVFSRPDSDHVVDLVGVLTLRELSVYRTKLADMF